jgi:four helix bundle protein
MATFQKFEEIISWQKARELNNKIGALIDMGIFKSNFRLINQIEGSAGSIMDNIAEGFERSGNKEFIQFLYIAKGSSDELRSQLYRAIDRKYIDQKLFDELYVSVVEISILIQKLINYLYQSEIKGTKYKIKTVANKTSETLKQ